MKKKYNKLKDKSYFKNYYHDHLENFKKYRIKKEMYKKHNISKQEWSDCKSYFNNQCAYCGMNEEKHKALFNGQLHKEHVLNNGSNELDNCVPACKTCNCSKYDYDIDEWYSSENPIFNEDRYKKILKWLSKDYKIYKY